MSFVKKHFEIAVIVALIVTLLPAIYAVMKSKTPKHRPTAVISVEPGR